MKEKISKFRLVSINRLIIYALFLIYPVLATLQIPGTPSIVSMLFILAFIYYYPHSLFKKVLASFPMRLWLVLTIYHWVNAMVKNVPGVDVIDLLHGLKIYSCIAIFCYLALTNFNETVKSLVICFSIFMLMSFGISNTSADELNGRMTGAIYSTQLGQTAALAGVYIAYYTLKNRWSIFKTGMFYILPLLVILFTQTRNALGMLAIIMIGHAFAYALQRKFSLVKLGFIILLFATVAVIGYKTLLQDTSIGKRLASDNSEQVNANNDRLTNTAFDQIAGDRLVYYVTGWKLFIKSPLTGIGMWNYRYVTHNAYPLHTEYMVQLCEGGLIAAVLWTIFIICLFRGIPSAKFEGYMKIIAFFALLEILFCGLYARVFFYEFFYPVIGIILAFRLSKKSVFGINALPVDIQRKPVLKYHVFDQQP